MNLDEVTVIAVVEEAPPGERRRVDLPGLPAPRPPAPWGWPDFSLVGMLVVALFAFTDAVAEAAERWYVASTLTAALDTIHLNQLTQLSQKMGYSHDTALLLPEPAEGMSVRVHLGAWEHRADYFAEVCLRGRCEARTAEGPLGDPSHASLAVEVGPDLIRRDEAL